MTYLEVIPVGGLSIGLFCAVVVGMLWVKEYRVYTVGDWGNVDRTAPYVVHDHDYDDRGLCGFCEVERRLKDMGVGARSVQEIMAESREKRRTR